MSTGTQRLLLALDQALTKLEAVKQRQSEPIAIIGMSCRFPLASNPEAFWELLRDSVCAVTEIPASRWDVDAYYDPDPQAPGKMYCRYGTFLEQVDHFDAKFFRISPREAIALDPQQRLLLEVSWEALERAGIAPEDVFGSQTGVFIGIGQTDYAERVRSTGEESIFNSTGNDLSFAAGRLSYFLGAQGPNMAIDTACSSSLVALHLAVNSLRQRECELALVGAVHLRLSPNSTLSLSRAQVLSPDGRCKTFDAAADGFGRGEGCGVIVLKRLSDAVRDGDTVLALIRGSAINHDGPSSGLTVPNEGSQEQLIRQALKNAAIEPAEVSYIEAHGTGTTLGDPIEVSALASVFAENKEDRVAPLFIGSVKTNLAHLEAAAGMAGLMKVILSLQNQEIPPHLHFQQPSPRIPWHDLPFVVPTERTPWTEGERSRIAGVSSFGMSGTNAHVVLSEAPLPDGARGYDIESEGARGYDIESEGARGREGERSWHILTLSAKTEKALRDIANLYEKHLRQATTLNLADVCFTANTGRSHFRHRLSLVASSSEEMCQKLASAGASSLSGVARGVATDILRPKVGFLFTGQGSQYVGMGQQLYESEPIFRQTLDRCDEILRDPSLHSGQRLERSLLEVLYPTTVEQGLKEKKGLLHETAYTQPALFALEYALAQLWLSWGVTPSVVMGHSIGEYVGACLAGVFSLEDALKLIAARGRLMGALPHDGAMVSVMASEALVQQAIVPYQEDVSTACPVGIAAINGPESVVISGKQEAVMAIAEQLATKGIKTRQLTVSHAFHSSLMEPMLDEFRQVAESISYHKPKLALVSNVTGKLADHEITGAEYWVRHVRETVRFADGMNTLADLGINIFLEIGPKATLLGMAMMNSEASSAAYLASLRESQNDWEQMLTSLGELYVRGVQVDWEGFDKAYQRRKVVLPTYPFQRERHYIAPVKHTSSVVRVDHEVTAQSEHPLLGRRLYSPLIQDICFESQISFERTPFLKDHQILGQTIFLVAGFVEMGISAAKELFGTERVSVEDMVYEKPLILSEKQPETVQLIVQNLSENGLSASFKVVSFATAGNVPPPGQGRLSTQMAWRTHAEGIMRGTNEVPEPASTNPAEQAVAEALGGQYEEIDRDSFYSYLYAYGYHFGPAYQGVQRLWRKQNEAIAEVVLPEALASGFEQYAIHPALLDACSHALFSLSSNTSPEQLFLTIGQERFEWLRAPTQRVWVHATLDDRAVASGTFIGNLAIYAATGMPESPVGPQIAVLQGYLMKQGSRESLAKTLRENNRDDFRNLIYEIKWKEADKILNTGQRAPVPLQVTLGGSLWLIFADQASAEGGGNSLTNELCQSFDESQATYIKVLPGQEFAQLEHNLYTIDPENPAHYTRILEVVQQAKYESRANFRGVMHLWSVQPSEQPSPLPSPPAPPSFGRKERGVLGDAAAALSYQQVVAVESVLLLAQALAKLPKTKRHARFRLFLITRGAQAVSEQDMGGISCDGTRPLAHTYPAKSGEPIRPLGAALWGLSRVIEVEHPELHVRYIDLEPALAPLSPPNLGGKGEGLGVRANPPLPVLGAPKGHDKGLGVRAESTLLEQIFAHDREQKQVEPLLALRQGRAFVPRLVKATLREDTFQSNTQGFARGVCGGARCEQGSLAENKRLLNDSTVLITGGLGGLGLEVAQWFAKKNSSSRTSEGRTSLALLGRSQPSVQAEEVLQKIRATGTIVRFFAADVSEWDRLATVLSTIEAEMPPLRGVIHAAGIQDDNLLLNMDQQQFRKVLAAKVQGAWNLHLLTAEMPLDFFVLFSSLASLLHKVGVSNYAAANAFLDGLAHYRRAQGLKGLSINWGAWADVGFLAKISEATRELWTTAEGVKPMSPQLGIQLFECLLDQPGAQYGACIVNWAQWLKYFVSNKMALPPLLADLVDPSVLNQKQTRHIPQTTSQPEPEAAAFVDTLRAAPPNERRARLTAYVRTELAQILGRTDTQLDVQEGFFDMGLDSLMSIELKTRLQSGLDCALPPTLAFNYPTIEAVVQHLLTNVLRLAVSGEVEEEASPSPLTPLRPSPPAPLPKERGGLGEGEGGEGDELAALLSEIDALPDDLVEEMFT